MSCAIHTHESTEVDEAIASTSEKMSNNQVALDAYHAVLKWDKWNIPALRGIAGILRSEDKFDQAVDYIRSILGVQPSDGESWSSLGWEP